MDTRSTKPWRAAADEINEPCGRFRFSAPSTASYEYAARAFLEHIGVPAGVHPHTGVPENWRFLLQYLKERGIIRSPRFRVFGNSRYEPSLRFFGLPISRDMHPTDGFIPEHDAGYGGGFTDDEAMAKTVGETLERFALSTYRAANYPLSSSESLNEQHVPPAQLQYFSPIQSERFPEFRHNEKSQFRWAHVESLNGYGRTLVPAQLVFWNYRHNDEPVIVRPTTSGCAGHYSVEESTLAALLELVQRDGFLIFWLNRISPPQIDAATFKNRRLDDLVAQARTRGVELFLLNTMTDIAVPSITCVAKSETGFAIGAGTAFDAAQCALSAAIEALQVLEYSASGELYILPEGYEPFSDATLGRSKRLRTWMNPQMSAHAAFLFEGRRDDASMLVAAQHRGTPSEQLAHAIQLIAKEGYESYRYEAGSDVLDQLGYHAVRVIVPGLVPLYLNENAAPLASERLRDVPKRLGYKTSESFNPWPHPFP